MHSWNIIKLNINNRSAIKVEEWLALIFMSLISFMLFADEEPVFDFTDPNLLSVGLLALCSLSVFCDNLSKSLSGVFCDNDRSVFGYVSYYFNALLFYFFLI
jgi:hypothetical protein